MLRSVAVLEVREVGGPVATVAVMARGVGRAKARLVSVDEGDAVLGAGGVGGEGKVAERNWAGWGCEGSSRNFFSFKKRWRGGGGAHLAGDDDENHEEGDERAVELEVAVLARSLPSSWRGRRALTIWTRRTSSTAQ